jgi:hypothetical protein
LRVVPLGVKEMIAIEVEEKDAMAGRETGKRRAGAWEKKKEELRIEEVP